MGMFYILLVFDPEKCTQKDKCQINVAIKRNIQIISFQTIHIYDSLLRLLIIQKILGDYGWGLAYSSADSTDQVNEAKAHECG